MRVLVGLILVSLPPLAVAAPFSCRAGERSSRLPEPVSLTIDAQLALRDAERPDAGSVRPAENTFRLCDDDEYLARADGVPLRPLVICPGASGTLRGIGRTLCRTVGCQAARMVDAGSARDGAHLFVAELRIRDDAASPAKPGAEDVGVEVEHWLVRVRKGRIEDASFLLHVANASLSWTGSSPQVGTGWVRITTGGYGAPASENEAPIKWTIGLDPLRLMAVRQADEALATADLDVSPGLPMLCIGHIAGPCPRGCDLVEGPKAR